MTALDSTSRPRAGARRGLRVAALMMVAAVGLAACDDSDDNDEASGIDTLGGDFVRAFSQDLDDEPLDASEVSLTLTPGIEPFDPA